MCDRILGKYRKTQTVNHLWNTVVNLRVKMIWSASKNNTVATCDNELLKCFFGCLLSINLKLFLLLPAFVYSGENLFFHQSREVLVKLLIKSFAQTWQIINRQERIHEKQIFVFVD